MKQLLIKKEELKNIVIGAIIIAFAINWFFAPVGLVTGGISGIGIIVEDFSTRLLGFTIPISLTTLLLNVPLFIIGAKQKGIAFIKKSLYAVVLISFFIEVTNYIPNVLDIYDDLMLVAIIGGVGSGMGIGFVLKAGATTGGTDMLATLIKMKTDKFPIAKLVLLIDAMIVTIGLFAFGINKAIYAIIAVYIASRVLAGVLEGMHYAKAAFIMSEHTEEIAQEIMEKIPRGSTGIKARGMYSKVDKEIVFTVVSQKEVTKLRAIINSIDPHAFVAIADVREVFGKGFIEDYSTLTM